MKNTAFSPRLVLGLAALSLFTFLPSTAAAEVLPLNAGFDDSADGWAWEDWSAAGSAASFDPTRDAGALSTSGSLRLEAGFDPANQDYQQAVFTLPLPEPQNIGELFHTLSFDVMVDPSSVMRIEGDYGNIQVILRNGDGWDWVELPPTPLVANEWTRFNINLNAAAVPMDSVRAITIRLAQGGYFGPVHVNLDNLAFNEEIVIDNLDNGFPDSPPAGWSWESWSAAGSSVTWDADDYYGRATSGSARLDNAFQNVAGYQHAVYTLQLPAPVNAGTEYSHINLDVKVDPSSTARASGDYGFFEIILRNGSGWDWIPTGPAETTGTHLTSTEWTHLSMPVRSGDEVVGITLKLGENNFLGPVTLLIDNVTWTENTAPPPPPTLQIAKAASGLNLVATSTDAYGRHNIYAADSGLLGWYGAPEPVTYEFSILEFPSAADYPGFQAHLFLVPGTPGSATSPDWNEPTLLFLDVKAGEGGTGNTPLRWKVNEPGGNSQLYAEGLPAVDSSTILGTWKLTASGTGQLTITAPDGTTANVEFTPEVAEAFAGPLRLYLGVQPNSTANIGQRARIGHVKVSQGSTVWLEDDFSSETLDELKWVVNSPEGGVQPIPPGGAGYILTWGLPDSGFLLQAAPTLTNPSWSSPSVSPVNVGALSRQLHIPQSLLPGTDQTYFRLIRPEQVGPATEAELSAFRYELTPTTGADWILFLDTGIFGLAQSGQAEEFGNYTTALDASANRWELQLDYPDGEDQALTLEFTAATTGSWTLSGRGVSLNGTFNAITP